jgi:S-adenosyl-L-methionine hydrolase (adenosine-forming)
MRVLTFLSDFGSGSPYPAAMKAVAAGLCEATLLDISHDVPAQSVRGGAYLLWSVASVCPPGTVHCAVVDPGVGTERAALAVASGTQVFVGPDNGLLLPAARRLGDPRVYRLTNPAYWRTPLSATFHGRDVFAPAAGHLAAGAPISALGDPAGTYVDLVLPRGRRRGEALEGEVLWVDPFGNLITTIPGPLVSTLPAGTSVIVEAPPGSLRGRCGRTFSDVAPGDVVVLTGSDDLVEVAVNGGSAAARLGVAPGAALRIRRA